MSGSPGWREIGSSLGIRRFLVMWCGQAVSVFGSSLTGFALGVWVYQSSASVTQFTVVYMSSTLPSILISPLAGTYVDRWPRRRVMLVTDAIAGLGTLGLLALLAADRLSLGWILLATIAGSTASAFQVPAQQASVALLVPRAHLPRAAAMTSLSQSLSMVLGPLVAGVLMAKLGLRWILILDALTFLLAVTSLALIHIPDPERKAERRSVREELVQGWRYLRSLRPMVLLLQFEVLLRFRVGVVHVLITPLVLAFATAEDLGRVLSLSGIGMITGSVLMMAWGGPRRRMDGVLLFQGLGGVALIVACFRPSVGLVGLGIFFYYLCIPLSGACSQSLWQIKIQPAFHGRVFALRRLIGWSGLPLAYLVAGPLSDHLFEPWMATGGPLAPSVGSILGVGPGRGIALLFGAMGLFAIVLIAAGTLYPPLRYLEDALPDQLEDPPTSLDPRPGSSSGGDPAGSPPGGSPSHRGAGTESADCIRSGSLEETLATQSS